ncbi:MAG: hypothetical protein U0031_22960 [Thermomicrobiales bacterium]
MTFDRLSKRLSSESSRRRVLGGLLGGTAAVLAGTATLEAKRKSNARANGNGNGKGNGNNKGQGAGTEKVQICHRTNGHRGYTLITVGAPASNAHTRHGDTVCDLVACQTVSGCDDDGACTYEAVAEGTECVTEDNVAGTCDSTGACVATDTGGGTTG